VAFVTLLRQLLRHKVLLALALVAGIAVGIVMSYRVTLPFKLESRQYHVGIASARVLVDTPSSQIVDLGAPAVDKAPAVDIGVLSARANLLASLMTSSPIKDEIARAAGVADGTLLTPTSASGGGAAPALSGEDISESSPEANVLRASVPVLASGSIPIIAVETQAPDPGTAAKIADQSVTVLRDQLDTLAGTEAIPADRRVTIRELGPARSTLQLRGPSRVIAVAAALFTFLAGCSLILLLAALINGWRSITAQERSGEGAGTGARLLPVRRDEDDELALADDELDERAEDDDVFEHQAAVGDGIEAAPPVGSQVGSHSWRRHDAG
jgi:hypothetical protein